MCWSASVSLNTFLFSAFATHLAQMNHILLLPNVIGMYSYITMQLLEYFVWSNTFSNKLISKMALILISFQPIALIFAKKINHRFLLLTLYLLFLMCVLMFIKPWNTIDFRMIPSKQSKHLSWLWLDFPLYVTIGWLIFLFLPFFLSGDRMDLITAGFFMLSIIYSYVMFSSDKTYGSIWCWISNSYALYLIYLVFMQDFCGI